MMDKSQWEQHGGTAFPSGDSSRFYPELGMSLRDYFAAQVMNSLLEHYSTCLAWVKRPEIVAIRAYEMADAMLKARQTKY